MDVDKLYICLEASYRSLGKKVKKGYKRWNNYYMIFSVKLSDLRTQLQNAPILKVEQSFHGPPSMGCGRFESKIVFAGGKFPKHNALITLDLTTQELSDKSFPSMQTGKVKPIVFELNKRLYVMDLSSGYRQRAIEYLYPPEKQWHELPLPEQDFIIRHNIGKHEINSRNYSFVVMGNTCCIDMPPNKIAYFHHPNYIYKSWEPLSEWDRFSGVATCYRQDGFNDSVIISFDNGFIRAHQFHVHAGCWVEPTELFEVSPRESNADMSGYFADFEGGIFSLSVSHKSCFYVYTFQFSIIGEESNGEMKFDFKLLTQYKIEFDHLPLRANILGIVGCFASSPNHQAIKSADEAFNKFMSRHGFAWRCDDDPGLLEFKGARYYVPESDSGSIFLPDYTYK